MKNGKRICPIFNEKIIKNGADPKAKEQWKINYHKMEDNMESFKNKEENMKPKKTKKHGRINCSKEKSFFEYFQFSKNSLPSFHQPIFFFSNLLRTSIKEKELNNVQVKTKRRKPRSNID
jgi:hypothetical protein